MIIMKKNGKPFGWDDYGYRVRYEKDADGKVVGRRVDRLKLTIPKESPKRPSWCPEGDSTFFQLGDSIVFVENNGKLLVNKHFAGSPYVEFYANEQEIGRAHV